MARNRRKKRRWLRTLLVFVLTPLTVWMAAFLIWFFWYDITRQASTGNVARVPGFNANRDGNPGTARNASRRERPQETIPEEDRKTLDDILKRR